MMNCLVTLFVETMLAARQLVLSTMLRQLILMLSIGIGNDWLTEDQFYETFRHSDDEKESDGL